MNVLHCQGTHVPVGGDNLQNVELSRRVAKTFNNRYFGRKKSPLFPIPQAVLVESTARVKSLRQPDKKMSKSDPNPKGCIYVTDSPDEITMKIKKAVTDLTSEVSSLR